MAKTTFFLDLLLKSLFGAVLEATVETFSSTMFDIFEGESSDVFS